MQVNNRLLSLDIFRGLAVGGMILANNPGDYEYVYPGLSHSPWHGWTPVDLVFPFFLFIVGVSIVFALSRDQPKAGRSPQVYGTLFWRSLLLFGLGLFYNGFPTFDIASIRIPGVLQRIAIVYLLACILYLRLNRRGIVGVLVAILLGYWALMTFVPVPGLGHPSLEKETNLAAALDRIILRGHLWDYDLAWDPEGILSTFPALCITLIGLLAGRALHHQRQQGAHLPLAGWGVALVLAGLVWDYWYPINKGLCTSSFVLFASGVALVLLAGCHWLADVKGQTRWCKPLTILGLNSLFIYLESELLETLLSIITVEPAGQAPLALHAYLYDHFLASWLAPLHASLAWSLLLFLLQLGLAWLLYTRKIFIRI